MNTEQEIQRVIKRLDEIAKANDDSFAHTITITKSGTRYLYECVEDTDHHTFVSAMGLTIQQALAIAETQIPDALADWGYIPSE